MRALYPMLVFGTVAVAVLIVVAAVSPAQRRSAMRILGALALWCALVVMWVLAFRAVPEAAQWVSLLLLPIAFWIGFRLARRFLQ